MRQQPMIAKIEADGSEEPGAPIPGQKRVSSPTPASRREIPQQRPGRKSVDLVQGDLFLDPLREADPRQPPAHLYDPIENRVTPEDVEVAPGGRLLTQGLTPQDVDRLRLVQVIGLETEVRFVLRDVLERGLCSAPLPRVPALPSRSRARRARSSRLVG